MTILLASTMSSAISLHSLLLARTCRPTWQREDSPQGRRSRPVCLEHQPLGCDSALLLVRPNYFCSDKLSIMHTHPYFRILPCRPQVLCASDASTTTAPIRPGEPFGLPQSQLPSVPNGSALTKSISYSAWNATKAFGPPIPTTTPIGTNIIVQPMEGSITEGSAYGTNSEPLFDISIRIISFWHSRRILSNLP